MSFKYQFANVPIDFPGSQESTGKILKHRYAAQLMLGRVLKPGEIVVRKDENSNDITDNILVFSSRKCSRRWYSQHKKEHLIKNDDGTYDYDWDKINEDKNKQTKLEKKEKSDLILTKIKDFINDNPPTTIKAAAAKLDIEYSVMYSVVRKNSLEKYFIMRKHVTGKKLNALKMPRKELIDIVKRCESNKALAKYFNVPMSTIAGIVLRRGVSQENIQNFRYLNKEELKESLESGLTIKEIAQMLDTFEENVSVNLKIYGLKSPVTSFAFKNRYAMPRPEDFENEKPEEEKQDTQEKLPTENTAQPNIMDIFDKSLDEDFSGIHNESIQETTEIEINATDICNKYGLSLCDISFLTGKQVKDFSKNILVDARIEKEIEKLSSMKKILSKENVIALLNNGHDNKSIAKVYNCSTILVEHILNHI